jgi:trans-aconitate methyltransferase
MDRKKQNFDVYSQNASSFAEKFDRIGPRVADVREVFSLIPKENPSVLELGCGNGRDASEILKHTNNYLGIDFSPALVELARKANPKGNFQTADFEDFEFPKDLDAVFAFASLIHTPKEVQVAVLKRSRKH